MTSRVKSRVRKLHVKFFRFKFALSCFSFWFSHCSLELKIHMKHSNVWLTGSGSGSSSCVSVSATNLEPSEYVKFDPSFNEVFKELVALILVDSMF